MKEKLKNARGITLIALVITIIILLILVGVTINVALGENGLFNKSKQAVETYKKAEEKEAIQMALAEQILDNEMEGGINNIGTKLFDKTVENGSKWNIIIMNDSSKKTYGTGYTFIERGSNIAGYGKLNKSWLINDETNEMIELEDNTYTNIAFGAGVGTREGLIFNLDSSIIESASTKGEIESALGDNVELKNFNWDENSGVTKKSFKLDGIDDYIEIKYDSENEINKIAEQGFTFEFYGVINVGKVYNAVTREEILKDSMAAPLFSMLAGSYTGQRASFRFYLDESIPSTTGFMWTCPGSGKGDDFVTNPSNPHMFFIEGFDQSIMNIPVYLAFSLNCEESETKDGEVYYRETLYQDGKAIASGVISREHWNSSVETDLKYMKYFNIGIMSMGGTPYSYLSKMDVYGLRLYNRGLSSDEIGNNYNKLVAYHDTL